MNTYRLTGYGSMVSAGGKGSAYSTHAAGGGGGGRIALYFHVNHTFSSFRYLANGGLAGLDRARCPDCEPGGPGTVYLYHKVHQHSTLLIDNNGAPSPRDRYVNWKSIENDGCRAWILPESGVHTMAKKSFQFHFDELQIKGNGHFAVLPPSASPGFVFTQNMAANQNYNISLHFRYMIGDRTGTVHVGKEQEMDLKRKEIDLPFNTYVYNGGHVGLAPKTVVHGVQIHLAGILSHVVNLTLHHGGYMWLKHGGRTTGQNASHYSFKVVRIQDASQVNATTDPIVDHGITFYTESLFVEGGGILHGTRLTMYSHNITVDDGGRIAADGLGYHHLHRQSTHGHLSLHGKVNPGIPDDVKGRAAGAGHGASGGRATIVGGHGAGFAYGDTYEPYVFGSSGGPGLNNKPGGTGGGIIWMNVTGTFHIDGLVTSHGGFADGNGGGGGSGGSVLIITHTIKGYGQITADGGRGSSNYRSPGGGGGGGRVAFYFQVNETSMGFKYHAKGGASGNPARAENGGAGTAFLYHLREKHRTLIIDNGGLQPRDRYHIIDDYANLEGDGCRTWILPQSGTHRFAGGTHDYHFEELQIYGAAHVAILTEPVNTNATLFFLYMIGDRSGTFHIGKNQRMDLHRAEIDLPFSVRVYYGGYLGLAPITVVHGVSIWLHGELDHVEFMTLHHNGLFSQEHGGHTEGQPESHYRFTTVRIQDNSTVAAITDPVKDPGITFFVIELFIEGGGTYVGSRMTINAVNITIDDGGSFHSDGLGYRTTDPLQVAAGVNIGKGFSHAAGSSGGGYGGTSGRGAGTQRTGQPHGHVFQPFAFGSSGGGGHNHGGTGAGRIWFNVTNVIHIDGEVRANGNGAMTVDGGGGSGGSIWMHCKIIRGTGNITANGGDQYQARLGTGGGGAGGRIALYFWENSTYLGTFQSHGGDTSVQSNGEPGGPGTVVLYHEHHQHTTLYVNNNMRNSKYVYRVHDYNDLSTDSFKAWILPESGDHWLTNGGHNYRFDELQIYGHAHLAVLPKPLQGGASLHFKHMIGDRSGVLHVGPHQIVDLKRDFIDTPFSSFVYEHGYLGLAPDTELNKVFVEVEGTIDHVHNLTLVAGGQLRISLSGSTNRRAARQYWILGRTVIKARSSINATGPLAHALPHNITLGDVTVEGGGRIFGKHLYILAQDMTIDDGGSIDVLDGGYGPNKGPGE